ncbi:hypothetical protein HYT52_05155 [Candidatus Woesearchaeota archaeon]|nr:hypothetical protein [Candidatus Woesearchaeota archaeon]
MAYTHLLLREGELFLKGKNQRIFEQKLLGNLKKILSEVPEAKSVRKLRGRLVLPYFSSHQMLKRVFGIVSYSPVVKVKKDVDIIKQQGLELFKEINSWENQGQKKTFKVQSKRSDKSFPTNSLELNRIVGRHIEENSNLVFNVKEEKNILYLEINQDGAYLFTDVFPCFGGLPTGVEGKVALIVEDEKSILAGILMMKRGCGLRAYSLEKRDISLLKQFDPELNLVMSKNISDIPEEIVVIGKTFSGRKNNLNRVLANKIFLSPLIAYFPQDIEREMKKYTGV